MLGLVNFKEAALVCSEDRSGGVRRSIANGYDTPRIRAGTSSLRMQQDSSLSQIALKQEQLLETRLAVEPSNVGLKEALVELETKMRSYADVTRETQSALFQAHEKEQSARLSRCQNLRVVGLDETVGEDTKEVIMQLFSDTLQVTNHDVESVVRIGRREGTRYVLVRFATMDGRSRVLGSRRLLQGSKIWLDADLTPSQVEERKKEVLKVKTAIQAGFVAYMREDRAVVTTRRRTETK
ncbi:hypothetical protein R1sor_027195 [Riccia sorocarpa]|uniref:RRM domain-containing protein n=1 Tax=Riccia sorocarpa TaxID=122646 RepID=A0ABD3GF91_9MARC